MLKERYKTVGSLNTSMSQVRALILDRNIPPPEYDQRSLEVLAEQHPGIRAFLDLPLRDKARIQRQHRVRSEWGADAEQALANLQLMPKNVEGFVMTRNESVVLKRRREESLLDQNDALIIIPDFAAVLAAAVSTLQAATPSETYGRLVIALALVSGRRLAELVNGRSTFSPTRHGEEAPYALFGGQLKKRASEPPYQIPLLCSFAVFANGFRSLRKRQEEHGGVAGLTNAKCTAKYAPNVQRALAAGALPGLPCICIHKLRSVYNAAVSELFISNVSPPRTAMRILGHTTLEDSLHYSSARLDGLSALRASCGTLLFD